MSPRTSPGSTARAGSDADTAAVERFRRIRDRLLRTLDTADRQRALHVADIGCGIGVQCEVWAERGHVVHGLDIDASLVEAARSRSACSGLCMEFRAGTAESLPWPDESMDLCLAVEVLEHVERWERCLDEIVRILRPGGLLYVSTTNRLCPMQQEFNLPFYSWYPAPLKRRYERLSRSSHPHLARHTTYPAVNWFTFYQLRAALRQRGLQSRDRFDMIALEHKGPWARGVIRFVRQVRLARWLGHVATPYTALLARKE